MSDRGLELAALYFHPCERYALPNHPEFNRLYRCNIFKVYKYFFIYLENKNYLLHSFDCLKIVFYTSIYYTSGLDLFEKKVEIS